MVEVELYRRLIKDENKLAIFDEALKNGQIFSFDLETLTGLRRTYYSCFSGIIYLYYYYPTNERTIGIKNEILAHVFSGEDFSIMHGKVDSIDSLSEISDLSINSWFEVKRGNKTYVYDLISMLVFEKDVYYKLENPIISKISTKDDILRAQRIDSELAHDLRFDGELEHDFKMCEDTWLLTSYIPMIEASLEKHPFKKLLTMEVNRFKNVVDYEKIVEDEKKDRKMHGLN